MLKKLKSLLELKQKQKEDLDAQDIIRGLDCLSKYIRRNNPGRIKNPLHIVVAGGACSVLLLHNRLSTRDIDFFSEDAEVLDEIFAAKDLANLELETYHRSWINAEMIAYVANQSGCEHLFAASVEAGVVFYHSDVLVAYVADWKYQLVGKISRAFQSQAPADQSGDKDLLDAIFILHRLIQSNGGEPLDRKVVRGWYVYGPLLDDAEIEYVNNAYQRQFGALGIS